MAVSKTHTKLAATAKRLIDKNGAPMQMWREETTGPDYDPVIVTDTAPIIAVRSRFTVAEVGDGSRIKSTDIKLLLSSGEDPRQYEKIIDGADELQIIDTTPIAPGELNIMYKVQARL